MYCAKTSNSIGKERYGKEEDNYSYCMQRVGKIIQKTLGKPMV